MKIKSHPSKLQALTGTLTLSLCATIGAVAWAQREPKPEENVGFVFVAPEGAAADGTIMHSRPITPADHKRIMQEAQQLQRMTPAQRGQFFQKRMQEDRERALREALSQVGFTHSTEQNALLTFIREQEAARAPLRQQKNELAAILRQPESDDEQIKILLDAWKKATAEAKEKYVVALQQLDEKIRFSTQPRLHALMTVLGLLEDASVTSSGPLAAGAVNLLQPPGSLPAAVPGMAPLRR